MHFLQQPPIAWRITPHGALNACSLAEFALPLLTPHSLHQIQAVLRYCFDLLHFLHVINSSLICKGFNAIGARMLSCRLSLISSLRMNLLCAFFSLSCRLAELWIAFTRFNHVARTPVLHFAFYVYFLYLDEMIQSIHVVFDVAFSLKALRPTVSKVGGNLCMWCIISSNN